MSKNSYVISAKSIEEFKTIEDALITLPESVKEQLLSAELWAGIIKCVFKRTTKLTLPNTVDKITDGGTEINAHSRGFLFSYPYFLYEKEKPSFEYTFVELNKRV